MSPKFLVDTTCEKCSVGSDRKGFTLAVLFSRIWALKPFFDCFQKLRVPLEDCHLLIVDNTDKAPLGEALTEICKNFVGYFRSVRLYKTYREGGKVIVSDTHKKFCDSKLPAIILGYLDIARLTTTKTLINIEDDTLVPSDAILRLLQDRKKFGSKTFITGVECNRGNDLRRNSRLGAYWVRCEDEKLLERVSASPTCKGVVEIDACGHFCFITSKALFRRGFKNMYRYQNKSFHFAPDTYHTYNLKNQGVKILMDTNIQCIHIHPTPRKILYWHPKQAISTLDYYIPKWCTWCEPTGLKQKVIKRPEWW